MIVVHRFWMGRPRRSEWSRVVVEKTQNAPCEDWTPETLPKAARWALEGKYPRDVSNRVRYWLLAEVGGLWLDHDLIPLRAFPTDVWTAAVGKDREGSALCFPEAGHPMAKELLAAARVAPSTSSPLHTGSGLLNRVGRKHPDVRLEPRVLPFDSSGHPTGVRDPFAVHTWETSADISMGVIRRGA